MKKRSQIVWSAEDKEWLLRMVVSGITPFRAAAVFKRSVVSVQNQARNLGKPFPKLNDRKRALRYKIEAAQAGI
jgi:hypothetical protein